MAKSHLNTNKQFMIGNGILAFAVIFVVVIFVYMSLRMARNPETVRYVENYVVSVNASVCGDSLQIYANDSLVYAGIPQKADTLVSFRKFAEDNSLLVVDMSTGYVSTFELDGSGENVVLSRNANGIVKK